MVNVQFAPAVPLRSTQSWSETLAACYDALAPAVFGVAVKITANEDVAARLTADVFAGLEMVTDQQALAHCVLADVHRRAVTWVRSQDIAPTLRLQPGALDALPEAERDVLTAAYFCGETYDDIAARMQLSPAEVITLMQNGLRRLQAVTTVAVP